MIKVSPLAITHSACKSSLDWLLRYGAEWIKTNVSDYGEIWLPDDNHLALTSNFPKATKHTEIILTGSFLMRLIELPYWKLENIRLWTFSSTLKKTLVDFLDIPADYIGIIPHPDALKKELKLANAQLVYVGRLNWAKNIEALLYLTSHLQHSYSPNITLNLVGALDELPDESHGRIEAPSLSQELQKIIDRLNWLTPPQLSGYQVNWKNQLKDNSHFISLSTSMYEDFGVAAHEASLKIPTLLSSWGGHWDHPAANLLASELIFQSFEPEWSKKQKTALLAEALIKGDFVENESTHSFIPTMISHKELSQACVQFIDRSCPEILLMFRDDLDTFADTDKGKALFHRYRTIYGGRPRYQTLHIFGEDARPHPFDKKTLLIDERDLIFNVYQKFLFQDLKLELNGTSQKVNDFIINTLNRTDAQKL